MTTPDSRHLPEGLFQFALIPEFDRKIDQLASLAEDEDWDYHNTRHDVLNPVLNNYIKYTWKRIAEEKKVVVTSDEEFACWNTGLVSDSQEPIYMVFERNKLPDRISYWHFCRFAKKGERDMNRFKQLPDMAHYFDDPAALVFDPNKELRVNVEHIVRDNIDRFPPSLKGMNSFGLQNLVKGAIDSARERVRRNYKTAIPQYYQGSIQILLPLCLTDPRKADLALAVERFPDIYRAATCLTLDMAYNNARQLARPDRDWLQP